MVDYSSTTHIEIPVVCESSKHVLSIQMTNQLIISVSQYIMHAYEVQWQDFKMEELAKGITDGFNARSHDESEISMVKIKLHSAKIKSF